MSQKTPRWPVPVLIWLVSVLSLSHIGHLWMLISEPSATQDAQYGVFLFMGMGYGWVLGALPAGFAWQILGKRPKLWRPLVLCTLGYWAFLLLAITLTEWARLGSPMTLRMLSSFVVAIPVSLSAVSMVLFSPLMLGLCVIGFLPFIGLIWWFGRAPGRSKR